MTAFTWCGMRSAPCRLEPPATAATKWTGALRRRRGHLGLRELHGSYYRISFLETVGDLGVSAIADAGLHAQRLRRGHRFAAAGRGIGGQDINRSRRWLRRARPRPCPAANA